MEILQGVWKQHLRPRAVVGYGVKIFLSSPANYVTRSPGETLALNRVCNWRTNKSTETIPLTLTLLLAVYCAVKQEHCSFD